MTTTNTTTDPTADRSVRWTRIAARTAAAVVALVAGAASFEHIASVAIGAGERAWVGYSLPFAIDGLIIVGVTALIEDQRTGRKPRPVARLAVLVGVVATLAANVASAQPTATGRLVALAAPVSFLLAVEVLTRTGRTLTTPDDTTPATSNAPPAPAPAPSARPPRKPAARKRPTAAQRVVKAAQAMPEATSAQIAARLHLSERTVQRYRPADTTSGVNGGLPADPARRDLAPVAAGVFRRPTPDGHATTGR